MFDVADSKWETFSFTFEHQNSHLKLLSTTVWPWLPVRNAGSACVCVFGLLFTAVYLPTFRLIINATLKVPCEVVLIKPYEGLFTAENLWRDLFYFFCQGIRNQTRPLVSVSNHLCSDSCCLIMVCEDSRPNPLRHPHILLWGSHSPGPGGEEFFPRKSV